MQVVHEVTLTEPALAGQIGAMDEHYTTQQLKDRGWTARMIETHLGKPDEMKADPKGRLRKQIKLYHQDRVQAAEGGTARADLGKLSEARDLARRAMAMKKQKTHG